MDNLPHSFDSTKTLDRDAKIAFIGAGVMAESIVAGILKLNLVKPEQIAASHPRANRRDELSSKYGIRVFAENTEAVRAAQNSAHSIVFLCVKPQRIKTILNELQTAVTPEQLIVSIVAGAKIETIAEKLDNQFVARVMPKTPAQIRAGMSAWTCSESVTAAQRAQVKVIFGALGT